MIVFPFGDDRKFPLVSIRATLKQALRIETLTQDCQRGLRIVTTAERCVRDIPDGVANDARADIVLALPLKAVGGEPERIELEVSGDTRFCEFYVEGSDDTGVGVVWKLSGEKQDGASGTHPTMLSAAVAEPHEHWDRNGGDPEQYDGSGTHSEQYSTSGTQPTLLMFHRLRIAVTVRQDIDIVLRELRVSGDVHIVPAGLSDN